MSYEVLDEREKRSQEGGNTATTSQSGRSTTNRPFYGRNLSSSGSSVVSAVSAAASARLRHRGGGSEPLAQPLTSSEDPFDVFRKDLMGKLDLVDESLAELLRIIHHTDTAVNTYELKNCRKQFKRHLKNAEATLQDIQMAVQVIERDRESFAHVDDQELYERQSLVRTSMARIERARLESQSEAVKAKLLADERAKALRRAGTLGAETDEEVENTRHIVDSQARTSLLMQHQDDTLDELGAAVTRVGVMADNIHDEIKEQGKMLDEFAEDLDQVEEELGLVMGKLAKFLQTKDRWQLGTILALTLVMLVLLLLVIYT